MEKNEKLKALDAALGQIEKQFGKGAVMKLGDPAAQMNIETIPTGSLSLDIDDEFAIDFRKRCEEQNGEINGLNYYSDQQIREYLTNENSLIIFYTPLGMEVGIHYDDGWATVTYKDYEKFTKQF